VISDVQLSAAALPAIELAAHQSVWTMYTISSFSTATLEQAGPAFLPQATSRFERDALISMTRLIGICMGALLGLACWALASHAPALFTKDAVVQFHMGRIAPLCGAVMVIVGADVSAVAVLISMGRTQYLARSFLVTLVAVAAFLYGTTLVTGSVGLLDVWAGLLFFFGVRCVQSYVGILLMKRRYLVA
jgi:Na+-driven multidrug efflux pump